MQYLVDTQIAVWIIENNSRLSEKTKTILQNPENEIFFCQVSLIELSIKFKIGKLPSFIVGVDIVNEQLITNGLLALSIENKHIWAYQQIPFYEDHRDPFDRLILATTLSENITIISSDEKFERYNAVLKVTMN